MMEEEGDELRQELNKNLWILILKFIEIPYNFIRK